MSEEKKAELAPIAEYEVLDQVDDQAIVEMMTGQAIKDYVYSFKQGGKTVEGLTLAGINEAANRRGGIQVEDVQFEERERSWIVIAKAVDTVTGSSRYGAYEQAKSMGSRPDPFAFTKAVHKAQRNAIKQLLPVPVIKEVLNYYLHRNSKPASSQMELPDQSRTSKISSAQRAAFAIANKMEGRLQQRGITQADFWSYVKRRYGVESRNDMSELQWTQLSAELNAADSTRELFDQMLKRIGQLEAAVQSSGIPDQQEPTPPSGSNGERPDTPSPSQSAAATSADKSGELPF